MKDDGIIDLVRNPFRGKRNDWVKQKHGLTDISRKGRPTRKERLPLLFGKDEASIREIGDNDGTYIAFVAIRWEFAEMSDGKLSETPKWRDRNMYDDHGQRITNTNLTRSESKSQQKRKSKVKNTPFEKAWKREDLIAELRQFNSESVIKEYLLKDNILEKSPIEVFSFAFGKSIYRAFHNETPTKRYKEWRWYKNSDDLFKKLDDIQSQEEFDEFVINIGESLVDDWGSLTNSGLQSRMNIGVALKISNLVFKHLAFSKYNMESKVIQWLHVPWDSYTLKPLREIYRGHPEITKKSGQGFVKNLSIYQELYSIISDIAKEAGVLRIIYEIWAWDMAHPKPKLSASSVI